MPVFQAVFEREPVWAELLRRLPAAGLFNVIAVPMERILKLVTIFLNRIREFFGRIYNPPLHLNRFKQIGFKHLAGGQDSVDPFDKRTGWIAGAGTARGASPAAVGSTAARIDPNGKE